MNLLRKGNKELIKDLNRSLVINMVRIQGNISRTDIAKETGLGLSTITNIIDDLIKENLVSEIGTGESHGGRKPVLLKFNGDFGIIVGLKIEKQQVKMCLSNLEGKILHKNQFSYSLTGENQLAAIIIEKLDSFIKQNECVSKIVGIGIATPGLVDQESNEVIYSPILKVDHGDLKPIGRHFDVPLFIDNDANVFALAEKWVGIGREYRNFIGVTVGAGVGSGIVIDNMLFRGDFGGAGELGHITIYQGDRLCYCGQRGCLELYASDTYLVHEAERMVSIGVPTLLESFTPITPECIVMAAQRGDKYAQELLVKQGENLALGIKNMVHLFNPEAVILGGEGLREENFLLKGLQKELAVHFFVKHPRKLQFKISQLGDDVWLIGACALVVSHLFKVPIYK
ncbi:ROK family transcriptional regulator [Metabacillus arenae]|uniref:ROK family transcriptional regulator n=1 Tax=Metabacillus arenae TaxID=2771434 RepID=A0A926RV40_9BACI|nr:ROK family transcriptional regulator [Metabacillus arenae]MBD1379278.1 ROK family transcriptional regulator [Metabacillus arenae]